jgi:hypothetical protein
MRKKIRQPFEYGKFLIEFREQKNGLLRILKEKIDTLEDAQLARERLIQAGFHEPTIRKIG